MRDLIQMVNGKRSAQWDHTAALILTVRKCAGDKNAKFDHPYINDGPKTFKDFRGK